MVESISAFKPWQIVLIGGIAVLAGMFAVAGLAHLGYALFPGGWGWVALAHIAGTGAAFFYISRPFVEAYIYRDFLDAWQDISYPPLDVFDDEDEK